MRKDKNRALHVNTTKEIANRIARLRTESGKARKAIASDLIMEYKTWSRIENGERNLTPEEIATISEYFNVSCDEILRGEKPEYFQIQQKTGLSQKSIDYLSENIEKQPQLLEILNFILEDAEKADTLLNALYIYATSFITTIDVSRSDIIRAFFEHDANLKQKAIWGAVESLIFSVCEKTRIEYADKLSELNDEKAIGAIRNIMQYRNRMIESATHYDITQNGLDFNPREADGKKVFGIREMGT